MPQPDNILPEDQEKLHGILTKISAYQYSLPDGRAGGGFVKGEDVGPQAL